MGCTPSKIHHRIYKGEVSSGALPNSADTANLGQLQMSDPKACKPRDRTVRARAKELKDGENKGVAVNGLTNKHRIPLLKIVYTWKVAADSDSAPNLQHRQCPLGCVLVA